MWRWTKRFLLLLLAAFLIGSIPSIINLVNDTVVYSVEKGISLHPHFVSQLMSLWHVIKNYTWHIIILYACFIGFMIFKEGHNPDRTILWLLVLIFVPVFGVLIYLVVGPDFSNYRKRMQYEPPKQKVDRTPFTEDKRYLTGRLLHACSGAALRIHNRVRILFDGDETFGALKEDLRAAGRYINFQYFIINDDPLGGEMSDILIDAAKRGVKVHVLYDAIGSRKITAKYVKNLRDNGVECCSFMPVAFPMFRRQMNYRNHRKIVVIDGAVGYTGGLNVGDEYRGRGPLGHWRDTHVRIEGEAVADLDAIFCHDWHIRTGRSPDERKTFGGLLPGCEAADGVPGVNYAEMPMVPMQVAASGADTPWHVISMGYFSMITRARERVWITTPYLVPGPKIETALEDAALSGVDVRIIMPAAQDHFLVYWGSRSNIDSLLRAGVRVFLYGNGFVHAKTIVADDDICSVGTCNMDVRSLEINFEDQLFIYDRVLNNILAEKYENDIKESHEVTLEEWVQRPFIQKMLESFGKLYSAQI